MLKIMVNIKQFKLTPLRLRCFLQHIVSSSSTVLGVHRRSACVGSERGLRCGKADYKFISPCKTSADSVLCINILYFFCFHWRGHCGQKKIVLGSDRFLFQSHKLQVEIVYFILKLNQFVVWRWGRDRPFTNCTLKSLQIQYRLEKRNNKNSQSHRVRAQRAAIENVWDVFNYRSKSRLQNKKRGE